MTVKVDPTLKGQIAKLAAAERRTPSAASSVLLEYGLKKWKEAGSLQELIEEIDGRPK